MDQELDRLLAEVDAAEAAFRQHLHSGAPVTRGGGPLALASEVFTPEWSRRLDELRAARDVRKRLG